MGNFRNLVDGPYQKGFCVLGIDLGDPSVGGMFLYLHSDKSKLNCGMS